MPELAVIMPCHNGERTLEQAVRSVLAQTFTEWELVIVNDGSIDGSADLIARLVAEDPRIRVLTNKNASGAAAARNRALKHAETRYVAFLDSDDAWLPHKLELQLRSMKTHNAALVCGAYDVIDAGGKLIGSVQPSPGKLTYRSMMANNSVGCLTAVLDRSLCGPVPFDQSLP
jgi:teichuronic acid biosynthesis glycosyltransferase TuaG